MAGPENAEEYVFLWKKIGGWVPNITLNKFSAYVPEDLGFSSLRNWFVDNIQGQSDLKDFSILKKRIRFAFKNFLLRKFLKIG